MQTPSDLYFRQMEMGPMANFVYLVGSLSTREAVVVDPAWEIDGILSALAGDGMTLKGALVSHTHPDHVGGALMGHNIPGLAELLEQADIPVHVHAAEAEFLATPASQIVKTDGQTTLELGEVKIEFVHTPGHTPGSQCFRLAGRLVSGDTLFIGGCGRTDLPGSNPEDMYESLTQRLMKLPDDTMVFPGHNYAHDQTHSSIGQEKAHNPYFQFPSKTAFLRAMGYNV